MFMCMAVCEICNVCIRERTIYVFRMCASFWHVCIGQWNMIHLIVSMSPITKHSKFLFLGNWIISMAQSHSPQEKKLRQRWWKHGIYILSNVIMLVYYNLQKNDSLISVDLSYFCIIDFIFIFRTIFWKYGCSITISDFLLQEMWFVSSYGEILIQYIRY